MVRMIFQIQFFFYNYSRIGSLYGITVRSDASDNDSCISSSIIFLPSSNQFWATWATWSEPGIFLTVAKVSLCQYDRYVIFYSRSYRNLFTSSCKRCNRHLQKGLPPTWRDFHNYTPYHFDCRHWKKLHLKLPNNTVLVTSKLPSKVKTFLFRWKMNQNPLNEINQTQQIKIELHKNIQILRESLRQVKNLRSTVDQVFKYLIQGYNDDFQNPDSNKQHQKFLHSLQTR